MVRMRFEEFANAKVAIWGYGREGRSVLTALHRRFPGKALTLYCRANEAGVVQGRDDAGLRVVDVPPDADALAAHDIVIKSPGISAYKPEII
ncbi:MAG: UDP-N-acetylmuramoyl-L-alanine--D-glutamate ligase, partial [Rhodanobacteraceae bacterium]